ncbi:MAG TPA: RecX family transcriptional regulator [Candidatus Saccharimonadales bacterium]|nr:RecX family transcriptional regulator [Candidatus Saccharimonadales bacterium]
MAVITSIKQQKKKDRINVYLDGKFGFGIDLDNFVLLNLRVGQELSENEVKKVIGKADFQKVLEKLLNFIMFRSRSEKEVSDWLYRKKVPETMHKDLFIKVKQLGLLDDIKFAKWWIESRQLYRPKPKRILEMELRKKGINKEIISEVLNETEVDEGKIAIDLLQKRNIYWKRVEKDKLKQKMIEYLVRKGFGFEIAKNAIKDYNNHEDDKI